MGKRGILMREVVKGWCELRKIHHVKHLKNKLHVWGENPIQLPLPGSIADAANCVVANWCLLWWQPENLLVNISGKGSHQAEGGRLLCLASPETP